MTYEGYDGVVYDLDGTLVRLAVDWDAAARAVVEVYREAGIDAAGRDLWDLFDEADEHGIGEAVESALSTHEREGARRSRRLPLADELSELEGPVGVCSLNCESACRIALETHDLIAHVDAVVGRDTTGTHKPAPGSLLATIERIGLEPDRVVFVGDSERDEVTARRAGVDFQYVDR